MERLARELTVVTNFLAVGTLDFRLFDFTLLLGAVLAGMTNLCKCASACVETAWLMGKSTLAVAALGDATVLDDSSLFKALHVLYVGLGPGVGILGTTRSESVLEGDDILLINLTLQVDDGVSG